MWSTSGRSHLLPHDFALFFFFFLFLFLFLFHSIHFKVIKTHLIWFSITMWSGPRNCVASARGASGRNRLILSITHADSQTIKNEMQFHHHSSTRAKAKFEFIKLNLISIYLNKMNGCVCRILMVIPLQILLIRYGHLLGPCVLTLNI